MWHKCVRDHNSHKQINQHVINSFNPPHSRVPHWCVCASHPLVYFLYIRPKNCGCMCANYTSSGKRFSAKRVSLHTVPRTEIGDGVRGCGTFVAADDTHSAAHPCVAATFPTHIAHTHTYAKVPRITPPHAQSVCNEIS